MATLKAALDAIDNDSGRWDGVADELGSAETSVDGLVIADGEFPSRGSLDTLYEQLRTKVARLLREGKQESSDIADELLTVRSILTGQDEQAKLDLERLWDYDD